jgi:DNA-damage-inducible protein J
MQFATRIDDDQGLEFKQLAAQLGTTPSDALRMFITSFNRHKGFPFEVRVTTPTTAAPQVEPVATEEEAAAITSRALKAALDEAW